MVPNQVALLYFDGVYPSYLLNHLLGVRGARVQDALQTQTGGQHYEYRDLQFQLYQKSCWRIIQRS